MHPRIEELKEVSNRIELIEKEVERLFKAIKDLLN